MRVPKNKKNKLCLVYWEDVKGEMNTELDDFVKKGYEKSITVGWLVKIDTDIIVVASEISQSKEFKPSMRGDFTMIKPSLITKVEDILEE